MEVDSVPVEIGGVEGTGRETMGWVARTVVELCVLRSLGALSNSPTVLDSQKALDTLDASVRDILASLG